ncbi:MAG: hypothetical protein QNJ91_16900 [Gammaproteobacteria bacterium]|nr:hypothetical protein [Gammaproteobacteria bacterium]
MGKLKPTRIIRPRIVQPGGSGRTWLWLLFLVALGLWTWQVFEFGRQHAGLHVGQRDAAEDRLRERIAELEDERDELRQAAARFERSGQIDRAAADGVKSEVKALQNERAELKREVAFLKTLVSGGSSKLALDDSRLTSSGNDTFQFEVTLSKQTDDGKTVAGQAVIRVKGRHDGIEKTLDMATITAGRRTNIGIKFKNFQKLKTEIKVPAEFEPLAIEVSVRPEGKQFKSFEQVFDWKVSDA